MIVKAQQEVAVEDVVRQADAVISDVVRQLGDVGCFTAEAVDLLVQAQNVLRLQLGPGGVDSVDACKN